MSETTTKKEFDNGDRAWTRDGVKVVVEAETTAGMYLVSPLLDIGSYDPEYGPASEDSGPYVLVDELFAEPPRQFVDEQMAKAKEAVAHAVEELAAVQIEIRNATAERRRLADKLKDIPALQYIEAAVDGRFTHMVTRGAYESVYQTQTMEQALASSDRYSKGLKLLSLYGDAKGDFQWRIHHYSDGSGSATDAWPFTSEEEALAFLRKRVAEDIALHSGKDQNARPYFLVNLCKQARKLGVAVPAHVEAMERAEARKSADHSLAEARKGVESAKQRLAVVEAQAKELLS